MNMQREQLTDERKTDAEITAAVISSMFTVFIKSESGRQRAALDAARSESV